jgi:alpha-tubulin suppressor-like RCC1 family protein
MDGTVRCWSANSFGQTGLAVAASPMQCDEGDGTPIPCVPTPAAVAGLTGAAQLSAGRNHTCARLGDSTLRCRGLNDCAQLGLGRIDPESSPQISPAPVALPEVAEVAAGGSHTCARHADGTVLCWASLGQLDVGTASTDRCAFSSDRYPCALTLRAVAITAAASISGGD